MVKMLETNDGQWLAPAEKVLEQSEYINLLNVLGLVQKEDLKCTKE